MPERRDQDEVLRKKGNVTKSDRGLQVWGDEAEGDPGQAGTGSEGTASRAARITRGQRESQERA